MSKKVCNGVKVKLKLNLDDFDGEVREGYWDDEED